ncbi:MAG: DUF493 family protein, partial [Glaciimonas sp.]|nr:DUF493 family protein [Glaciimonas sp.]
MDEKIIPHDQSFVKYPCTFPIKIMGPTHDAFAETIIGVVVQHDPTFT